MTSKNSAILIELQEILHENGTIPPKVSNRLILAALIELYGDVREMRGEVRALKNRASMWGAVAGFVASITPIVIAILLKAV